MSSSLETINKQGVSIVIPCYNSELTLGGVLTDLCSEFRDSRITRYEIILVVDCPKDNTLQIALARQKENSKIRILVLNRNFGQHAAIFAGLDQAKFNFIVTMDDDGQHLASNVQSLLVPLCGDIDVVYGVPKVEEHSHIRNFFSRTAKYVTFKLLKIENTKDISAFRAFKKIAIEGIEFRSLTSAVVDVVLNWNTNRFLAVKVDMAKRITGKSNYTYYKLFKFALQMIIGYSIRPLRIATIVGLIIFFISSAVSVGLIFRSVTGEIVVPGYFSMSLFVLFLGSIQLITLGLIGEYLGKIHEHSMGKPLYLIKEVY
jgi:glycosyltransferase involved in cell wall biosynthesis